MKASEIAELVGGELCGDGDAEIVGVADLHAAGAGQIAFYEKSEDIPSTGASCVIVPASSIDLNHLGTAIKTRNPKLAFARVAAVLHPKTNRQPEIHRTAVVADSARLGAGVFVGAFVCVGDNSVVGDGTQLRAGAKIGDHVTLGKNCTLHPNA